MTSASSSGPITGQQCVAHSSRTGLPCKARAVLGATVCVAHGGRAPQVKAAAARRVEEQRVETELGRLLVELEGEHDPADPLGALIDALRRAKAMVAVLGMLVGRLGTDDLYGRNHLDDGAPHVATEMYRTWITDQGRLAKLALDAGVEERQVRLLEAEVDRFARMFLGMWTLVREQLAGVGVDAGVLDGIERDRLPLMIASVIDTTAIEAA